MPTIESGITIGPGITTDRGVTQLGLVTDANANSTLSYSPNQFAYPKDIGSWMVQYGANAATLSRDPSVTDSPAGGVAMKMAVSGNDPYTATYNSTTFNIATAASGQTWTLSVYVKASVATTGELFIFGSGSAGTIIDYSATAISIGTAWSRVSFTFAFTNASVTNIQVRLDGPNSSGAGQNIWWDGLQLELGSSATTFAPYYNPNGALFSDTSVSKLIFSGSSTYARAGNTGITSGTSWSTATTDVLNNNTHTILFMVKFTPTGTYPNGYTGSWEKILSYNAGGSDRSPGIWRFPSNRYIHWRYDPGNTGLNIGATGTTGDTTPAVEFSLSTWYYVAVSKNGATATCYINGAPSGTATVANPKTAGTAPVILFEYYTASLANLNNLLIYNRVLSDAEVAQNFTAIRGLYGI
jgi:hypothetical protein